MGAIDGYGYKTFLDMTDALGGRNITIDTYIATDKEVPADATRPNALTEMYYTPEPFGCNAFLNYGVLRSKNSANTYKYVLNIDGENHTFSITLYDEDNTSVETITLYTDNNDGEMDFSNFCFAIRCGYTDINNPYVTQCGISCLETGIIGMSPVARYPVVWFTNAHSLAIIQDCISVIKVMEGGTISTRLKNSDDFLITKLPEELYSKNVINFDHFLINDIIPLTYNIDDEEQLLLESASCYHVPTNPLGNITYLGDCSYIGMFAIHMGFIARYGNDVGSDLFRKTADGEYTNGATLELYNDLTLRPTESSTAYDIEFEGGILRWTLNSQSLRWVLHLCDADGNSVDSWTLPSTRSPAVGSPGAGFVLQDVATAFLCKSGSNYYIVGECRDVFIKDADGNPLYDSTYNTSMCYAILKKFNTSANQILNNATETIVEFDKTAVEDDSEAGSMPENTDELNDNTSVWSEGEHQGENTGIRHNGSDIIDASNGELTGDNPVGKVQEPSESGVSRIPTALNTGMITGLAPTIEEMETFASLLNQSTFLQKITQFLNNPMDCVISAHTCIAPTLDKGSDVYLTYGVWSSQDDSLSMKTLTQQYYHCYMGSYALVEKRNSYKDYPPFCNYQIYLPYIGVRDIDGRILVGKLLKLYYHINVLTGDILAELEVVNQNSQIASSFYYWQGNTFEPFPLKSTDYSSQIQNSISAILSTGTAIASGVSGNVMGAVTGGASALSHISKSFHPDIRLMGTVSGNMAQLMYEKPYIIKQYPYLSETNPFNYERLAGLPSNIGNTLLNNYKDNPKFIKFKAQDLDAVCTNSKSFYATEQEKEEIASILESGVYI